MSRTNLLRNSNTQSTLPAVVATIVSVVLVAMHPGTPRKLGVAFWALFWIGTAIVRIVHSRTHGRSTLLK